MIRYCDFRQGKIRYKDEGKGRAVILLHGFLESLEIWNEVSKNLASRYRVISIDLPGHGKSDLFGYVHSMEMMAEAVMCVLRENRLRRVAVFGHSMGGYVAMAFAEMYPDYLRGFGLIHSSAVADNEEKKRDRLRAIEALKSHPKKFIRELLKNLFFQENLKELKGKLSDLEQRAVNGDIPGYIACVRGMRERLNREVVLKFSPSPVLIIAGKHDKIIPEKVSIAQAKLPEDCSYILLENSAHMGFYEESEKMQKALRRFVNRSFRKLY